MKFDKNKKATTIAANVAKVKKGDKVILIKPMSDGVTYYVRTTRGVEVWKDRGLYCFAGIQEKCTVLKSYGTEVLLYVPIMDTQYWFTVIETNVNDNYEVSVTRKGSNLYKIDAKNIYIRTRYCYEYVYSENAFLKMSGYSDKIIFFDSGGRCDVKAVYGPSEQKPGKYAVTINREDDDWYEIWGQGIYIKTDACLSLALGEEAILSIDAGCYGTLYVGDDKCMVEGVYVPIQSPLFN